MNKLLMTRTLVSNLRANFSTSSSRQGIFQTVKSLRGGQEKLQALPNEIHAKTGADRAWFGLSMALLGVGTVWGLGRSRWLVKKK